MPLINGDDGPNFIVDTSEDDTINGLAGDDTITVTNGNDQANGGDDFDTLIVSYGGATADISGGTNSAQYLSNGGTQNVGFGQFERFEITTGSGNDDISTDVFGNGNDIVNLGAGNDFARTGLGDDEANGGAGNDDINVGTGDDTADGGADTDRISANLSAAVSSIVWILPSNFYSGPIGSFTNFEYFGIVSTGDGNDAIVTGTGNFDETVNLGGGDDTITVSLGGDSVNGQGGNDTLIVNYGGSTAAVTNGLTSYGNGVDRNVVYAAFEQFVITTGSGDDVISTADFSGDDVLSLGAGNDLAATGAGNDSLDGGAGADALDGGSGADQMTGGDGNDLFFVDNVGDQAIETNVLSTGGIDTVQSSVNFTLGANVERLTLVGAALNGTGNGIDNVITGNNNNNMLNGGGGADTLDGGLGNDVMRGGAGNDVYKVEIGYDQAIETSAGDGVDRVDASVSFTLGAFVDNLTLLAGATNGSGNAQNNILTGNSAANRLDGGLGADTMKGGLGDDIYVVNEAGDVVSELAGQGTDKVESAISFTLSAALENLTLTGSADINGTGNIFANILLGNSGENSLDGGAGADTMNGGLGDDIYIVDNVGDTAIETSAAVNTDTVQSSVSYTIGSNIEFLFLTGPNSINGTGNNLGNLMIGNNAANILDGGVGADFMQGGLGNDTYVIDNGSDVVVEAAGGGTDTIRTAFNYTLAAELENLVLTGTGNVNGTGNGVVNVLTGNSGANVLDGGVGADTMQGGLGNDVYVVDNGLDKVIEAAAGGTDTVNASITHQIAAEVENLTLTGAAAINGFGNALANTLTGNGAANRLDGGLGADTLKGGLGDDIYVVDQAGDSISELAGQGTDKVESAVSFTLAAALENLSLTGSGDTNGTGNLFANTMIGNSGANRLDGGGGADSMNGGLGNDTYVVDNVGDVVIESSATGGSDTVESSVSYTLGATLELLTLTGGNAINGTGNAQGNTLVGNNAANTLSSLLGDDSLFAKGGNDTIVTGGGADGIYFDTALNAATNVDAITDFSVVSDLMYLDDAVFSAIAGGSLAAGAFRLGTGALDADDRILYDAATGRIFYDADGNAAGASAILFATVAPGTALTEVDFFVY